MRVMFDDRWTGKFRSQSRRKEGEVQRWLQLQLGEWWEKKRTNSISLNVRRFAPAVSMSISTRRSYHVRVRENIVMNNRFGFIQISNVFSRWSCFHTLGRNLIMTLDGVDCRYFSIDHCTDGEFCQYLRRSTTFIPLKRCIQLKSVHQQVASDRASDSPRLGIK